MEVVRTVAEYINNHPEIKVAHRVSAKGTELVKVYYPTGTIKEYPVQYIDTITAYEY